MHISFPQRHPLSRRGFMLGSLFLVGGTGVYVSGLLDNTHESGSHEKIKLRNDFFKSLRDKNYSFEESTDLSCRLLRTTNPNEPIYLIWDNNNGLYTIGKADSSVRISVSKEDLLTQLNR